MQLQANIVFVASKEVVLFNSRSPSNIVNGIAFQKLQNFVSLLYVILINFEKCNKRTDNFLKNVFRFIIIFALIVFSNPFSFSCLYIAARPYISMIIVVLRFKCVNAIIFLFYFSKHISTYQRNKMVAYSKFWHNILSQFLQSSGTCDHKVSIRS